MTSIRRLAAILAADIAGYSRLIGADEEGTLNRIRSIRAEVIDPAIASYRGRLVKTTGDGLLIEFGSVVDALRCAVEMQQAVAGQNAGLPPAQRIEFRIGLHMGDVVVADGDILGDGVNIAARLEGWAQPGGICVSGLVHDQVQGRVDCGFQDAGEQFLKNIARPIRVFKIEPTVSAASEVRSGIRRKRLDIESKPQLSIVVLPFVNLSTDPEQEYFADAITDDLTTDLSRISGSFVIARNTAFTYKGRPIDVRQIGRDLNVHYALEGSVRKTGENVRINVQLIDAETSMHLWADRFDTKRDDLDQAQDEITGRLAWTLNLKLVETAGNRTNREGAPDPDARDLAMRGWAWLYRRFTPETQERAKQAFEQALSLDSRLTSAKVGLARVLLSQTATDWSSSLQEDQTRAEQLLDDAIESDPNSSAHTVKGFLRRTQNRLAEARAEFETALALDPNNADAFRQLGAVELFSGQPDTAIRHTTTAMRLSPYDPTIHTVYWILGTANLFLGHVDQATDLIRTATTINPQIFFPYLWLAGALGLSGRIDEAKVAAAEALKLNPQVDSIARMRRQWPWGTPDYWQRLAETVEAGLRRAGFPDQ
jgi:TolB-like protein/Flp pilus assembly protein TadD